MIRHTHPAAALLAALTFLAGVGAAAPVAAQTAYNHFPGTAATDDGRLIALAGEDIETLAQDSLSFLLAVPAGETEFEIGIFDGETGLTGSDGRSHWDHGATQLQFALFYDPHQLGSTDPSRLLGVWRGNESNPVAGGGGAWTASNSTFPDDGWWNLSVKIPEPPEPLPGEAPSGASYYHLCVSYRGQAATGAADPCTGDARPVDRRPDTIGNFKLRASANISVLAFAFAYEAAMRLNGNADLETIYPEYDGHLPPVGSDYWMSTPTTYDGLWRFEVDVPTSQQRLRFFDGDFDFGTLPAVSTGFPSSQAMVPCVDSDDPDTPNDTFFPPFAVVGSTRMDDSVPEGAKSSGLPADDSVADIYRRAPCIRWRLISPSGTVYANDNPSSQREWEQFLVESSPACDASATCDPGSGTCADHCSGALLLPGVWNIEVEGVDLSNLNAWRATHGFCVNCSELPRPYLVGDTVFADHDSDSQQDPGEPGIPGVLVELLDENGIVLGTRLTGDSGSGYQGGSWQACQARNTGTGTPVDDPGLYCFDVSVINQDPQGVDSTGYTVRLADSNFQPGGAVWDFFGENPTATRPSPQQSDVVAEGGANVMTYDFGYWSDLACGACEGKVTRMGLRYGGTTAVFVEVVARRGPSDDPVFAAIVSPGGMVVLEGPDTGSKAFAGTLGTEIDFYVDGVYHGSLHTSCSQEVGPGTVVGDFVVVSAASQGGGPLCPVECTGEGCLASAEPTSEAGAEGDEEEKPGRGRGRGR